MIIQPKISGAILFKKTDLLESNRTTQKIIGSLPQGDITSAHVNSRNMIIEEGEDASLIVTKQHHNNTVETIQKMKIYNVTKGMNIECKK